MYQDNIMTYLKWRGDLTLKDADFCEIDSLILSQLVYLKFDEINLTTIAQAAFAYKKKYLQGIDAAEYHPREVLLMELAKSKRFSQMMISNYVSIFSESKMKQFAAMHIQIKKNFVYIAFRGTDKTLTGWREDFNMSYQMPVGAQQEAVDYLNRTANGYFTKYWLGGHSKGGNLALYAATLCHPRIQKKIQRIDTFDSPGYLEDLTKKKEYANLTGKLYPFVPQGTIAGILLEHPKQQIIVESMESGFAQHSVFTWKIHGTKLVTVEKRTPTSYTLEESINNSIGKLSLEDREQLVGAFFQVLKEAGVRSISDLTSMHAKGLLSLIRAMTSVPPENKELLVRILKLLKE